MKHRRWLAVALQWNKAMRGKLMVGSSLMEVLVATGIMLTGLGALYLGFAQTQAVSLRNASTLQGQTLLKSWIEDDSTLPYSDLPVGVVEIFGIPNLPNGELMRSSVYSDLGNGEAGGIKVVHYNLFWIGSEGEHWLEADYEHINKGVNNDG